MITSLEFRICLIIFFVKVNICVWLYINRAHFDCAMICIIVCITISSNLSIHTFFDNEVKYLYILVVKLLIHLSVATYFLCYVLNTLLYHYHATMISLIYCKIHCLYLPMFYLVCGLIHLNILWKGLVIVILFFISQRKDPFIFTIKMTNT